LKDVPATPYELLMASARVRENVWDDAAALAEPEYRTNPELTAFEAFGEDDLFDETGEEDGHRRRQTYGRGS